MASAVVTPEQDAEVEALADKLQEAHRPLIVKLARLLLSKNDSDLFGQTELDVRDLVHLLGAQAYETVLAQKKRLRGTERDLSYVGTGRQVFRVTARKRRLVCWAPFTANAPITTAGAVAMAGVPGIPALGSPPNG